MSPKGRLTPLLALLLPGLALAAGPSDLQIRAVRPDATTTIEKSLAENKALVRVVDPRANAILGLTTKDFSVAKPGMTGNVTSVEPMAQTVDVPRNAVIVLDNSFSMIEHANTAAVLEEVGTVVKSVRPIDDVRIVVFNSKSKAKFGGRDLRVDVLKSNNPAQLNSFAARAYEQEGCACKTVLYDAMLAGIELLKGMPADSPRFFYVFSDGKDLNSVVKREELSKVAKEAKNYRTYVTDARPGSKIDPYLADFASQNQGVARKPKGADMVGAFQQAATRQEHYYVVNYELIAPTPAPVAPPPPPPPTPKRMVFEAAALFDFDKFSLKPEGKEQLKTYIDKVKSEMSAAEKVQITGYTDSIGTAEYNKKLSLKRAEAVRDYLVSQGVDQNKLLVAGEGAANPIADNKTSAGRAKNRRVEVQVVGLGK